MASCSPEREQTSERTRLVPRLVALNIAGMLLVSVVYRIWRLGHMPGVNGDEAWYGVWAVGLLRDGTAPWFTPTGNLLNPFFSGIQVLLHSLFPPSLLLLRLPAVISGLAALLVNFALCRRVFDQRTAVGSTLILAVLPVNIAYSRFGWDASQTLLATLPVMYCALGALDARRPSRWMSCSALALGASLIVHPTNIFISVLPCVIGVMVWRRQLRGAMRGKGAAALAGVVVSLVCVCSWVVLSRSEGVFDRLSHPGKLIQLAVSCVHLFSGVTTYRYTIGSCGPSASGAWPGLEVISCNLVTLAMGVTVCWYVLVAARSRQEPRGLGLAVSLMVAMLVFFLVAGPEAAGPHWERYVLWLIAPTVLLTSRAVDLLIERSGHRCVLPLLLLGWVVLAGFYLNYFDFLRRTGGLSHRTFRTGEVDPKQAALEHVLRTADEGGEVWVVCSEWWSYWPVKYLAHGRQGVRVEDYEDARTHAGLLGAMASGRVWFLEFSDGPGEARVRQSLSSAGLGASELKVLDYGGKAVLSVIHPKATVEVPDGLR